ncbi:MULTISPECIES: hypothetical protein [Kingella]|uniref:Uncharacterized protein n=1 Tax=Kingella bonacorsii TaxID=2796361 RepID=A0ABS1BUV1_9NEIS|nr:MULTISPECIES: hypothetical protein [Kingella]MBK0397058.1 hypothetical protein [Kingella bonacorsii]
MVRGKPHTLRQRHRLFLIIPSTIKPIPPSSPSFSRKQEQAHQLLFRLPITHALRQPENVANPAINSASATRQHYANQQSLVEYHLATSRFRSIFVFRLPLFTKP